MNDYMPTTDEVREDFAFPWSPEQIGDRPARIAAFDRWLATHDAEVRAETGWLYPCPHWNPHQVTLRSACTACVAEGIERVPVKQDAPDA